MMRTIALMIAPVVLLTAASPAGRADEFTLKLKVDAPDHPVSTKETVESTAEKPPARPVVELMHDKPVSVSWHAENTSDSEEYKDVLVHFFVVKEEKTGQREIPPLTEDVTYEGALTADFKPHDDADWKWMLKIHEPGNYLLRVETLGMETDHGHNHFAAMDLIVK